MDPFRYAYCTRPDDSVLARAAGIRLLLLDVDGVLTDGTVFTSADGEPFKNFHIHDGKGIAMLQKAGVEVGLMTARSSPAIAVRARELGVTLVREGVADKRAAFVALRDERGLAGEAIAFVGDDLIDLGALAEAGLAVAVGDAHPRVTAAAHWSTRRPGGRGAVREVCELILAACQRLEDELARHV